MSPIVRRKVINVKVTDAEKRRYPSKHYVYIIRVTWDDGSDTVIFRRYSKFFDFQIGLLESFPVEGGLKNPAVRTIPFLPGKILFRRSHIRDVAMKRLKPIDEYVNELLKLPPHISQSEQVLNFFESKQEDLHPLKEETARKKKKDEQDISEISGPILLEQYTAISDYTRTQPKELTVTSGQMLEVIEKHENGWWFVSDEEGERGWVPGVYLEKRDGTSENLVTKQSKPGQGEKYVTTAQFIGGKDEVSFGVGVLVEVLQKNLEGWWLISYQGKEGLAPASYLEKPADAVLRQTTKADVSPSFKSSVEHRRSLPADAAQAVFPPTGAASTASPSNALSSRKHLDLTRTNSNPLFANRKKLSALPPSRPQPALTRPPPKKSSVKRGSFKPLNPPPLPPSPGVRNEPVYDYVTNSSFNADIPHGISFQQDKTVKVLEKSPGDWWYISLEGDEGWAPASLITRVFHKKKLRQAPHRPQRPTSGTKPSQINGANNVEENANVAKPLQTVNASLEKTNSTENGLSKPCLPGRPLPVVPLLPKTDSSTKTVSTSFDRTKSWKTKSTSGNELALSVKNDIHRSVERSADSKSSLKSATKPATVDRLQPDRKPVPPRRPIKPVTIPAKPKPSSNVTPNIVAKEATESKKKPNKPRPPSLTSKKSSQTIKEPHPKMDFDLNGNGRADFRSVLKPAPKKVIGSETTVKNSVGVKKKPLVLPEKPVKPDLPATKPLPAKLKPTPITTKREPASATRPKVPVSKPKPGRPASKPVLKRFQLAEEQQNLNGNNNAAEQNEKSLVVVNRVESEQIVSNVPLPFNLRGIPDGQVDDFKLETMMKTYDQKTSTFNIMPAAGDRKDDAEEVRYVAVRDFTPESDNEMGFDRGCEAILIQKSRNNWWFMKINGQCGWVPCAYFELKPLVSNDKTNRSLDNQETSNSDVVLSDKSALTNHVASNIYQPTLPDNPESLYSEIEDPTCFKAQSQNVCELYKSGSSFSATDNTMISLAYGDIVQLMHRADTGWWFVKVILSSVNNMDQEGWVPADYLDKL